MEDFLNYTLARSVQPGFLVYDDDTGEFCRIDRIAHVSRDGQGSCIHLDVVGPEPVVLKSPLHRRDIMRRMCRIGLVSRGMDAAQPPQAKTSASMRGYSAHAAGAATSENPYTPDDPQHGRWLSGWEASRDGDLPVPSDALNDR